jgi:hypothetical protein
LILPQISVALAMVNPLAGPDHEVATWFHTHLTSSFVAILRTLTDFGSGEWIGVVLFLLVLFFVWKRWWPSFVTLMVAVPGGMLLNELVKVLVQRQRPFVDGPFVDWSGYSFASGHDWSDSALRPAPPFYPACAEGAPLAVVKHF